MYLQDIVIRSREYLSERVFEEVLPTRRLVEYSGLALLSGCSCKSAGEGILTAVMLAIVVYAASTGGHGGGSSGGSTYHSQSQLKQWSDDHPSGSG
ncbi:MAG TPA: hypothetical protein VJI15_01780 [Candidatus Nanoarchaeia archaeon]|nr:hypothetical protein [Candidatus Nanoarchaeia archaeon]